MINQERLVNAFCELVKIDSPSDEEEDDNVSATNVSGNVNIDRGGDDPKIGAELEAGVVGDRVAERITDNVEEVSYKLGDLKWENKCMNFHKTIRPVRTSSDHQIRKKIYSNSINKWKIYKSK